MSTPIPLVDLKIQFDSIRGDVEAAIGQVLETTAFVGGPAVERFEQHFAAYCQCPHAVGTGSGTEALWLALLALGVQPGDEVITVPLTFIATAEAIHYCGATPIFVDVDETTYTMDPLKLEAAITPRTKAIIPVHLYGQPAEMAAIIQIAERHDVFVVEDACQAHGAEYAGRRAGSLGDAACFSFYPGKNLGAYGDGGAVVTRDADLMARLRALRDHGQHCKNRHDVVGWNSRLDAVQAAVLDVKLPLLDDWNAARRQHAQQYDELLRGAETLRIPRIAPTATSVYHLYVVRTANRDQVLADLREQHVHCGVHYPVPLHLQPALHHLGWQRGDFPVAEQLADEVLSLPMFPELTPQQITQVADRLLAVTESMSHEPAIP